MTDDHNSRPNHDNADCDTDLNLSSVLAYQLTAGPMNHNQHP